MSAHSESKGSRMTTIPGMATTPSEPAPANDGPRIAAGPDAAKVTQILTEAFHADGMWAAWAFPNAQTRRANREAVFRLFVEGALRFPATWLSAGESAAAVWIPPDESDLSAEQETEIAAWLQATDAATDRILAAFELFQAARPPEPHYYLSLLGTNPRYAGRGHGQRLLAHNLDRIDAEEQPAYLDTSDELVPLYGRFGFQVVGSFVLPDHGPRVNTMWRSCRRGVTPPR